MAKAINYPAEVVQDMVAVYTAAESDAERAGALELLAEKHGRTVASIRSKLASEGVYIAKAKTAKGSRRVKKEDILSEIAANAPEKHEGFFDSLAGANKAVLEFVRDLQNSRDAE